MQPAEKPDQQGSLLVLAALALPVGALAGLVGAMFRLALQYADGWRDALIAQAHGAGLAGFFCVIGGCAAAALIAAWLVRGFSPHASGSGIPHVEAVLSGQLPHAPFNLVPVKFVGGVLAIGSGLALGREGPSVQMGASLAHLAGAAFRRNWPDRRALLAAGAGAGLAAAFNAPIAGAIFVLEELVRRFETRTAIAALGASATAIAVSRLLLGDVPDFVVDPLAFAGPQTTALFYLLGVVAGFLVVASNGTLPGTLAPANRLGRWPVEARAGLIGAAVGVLAWFLPHLVGGGHEVAQSTLTGGGTLASLPLVFLLRFGLGAVSYAAQTPGGLFAPLLVVGAQLGLLFGLACRLVLPGLDTPTVAFAVVGMAAFFTGVVRAEPPHQPLDIQDVLQRVASKPFTAPARNRRWAGRRAASAPAWPRSTPRASAAAW